MVYRPVVVKIGGSTLGNEDTTLKDLVALQRKGVNLVVVHGGGKIISRWMERHGSHPVFLRGLRVTDPSSLEIVTGVLSGIVNKQLVASLMALGGKAIGLSGVDGGILEARVSDPELGLVGTITHVNTHPLINLLEDNCIPIIAPIGIQTMNESASYGNILNINGDTVAGELAYSLNAERLVFLTDIEGVMDTSGRLIPRLNTKRARLLLKSGVVKEGMIPKIEASIKALERVHNVSIVDGRRPEAILSSLRNNPPGTQIYDE